MNPGNLFVYIFIACFCALLTDRMLGEFLYEVWKRERRRNR
ncbi:hypothetical protein AB1L88_25815 [Tautonia sp. JC769]